MVATVARMSPGAHNYHLALTRASYLEAGEPSGIWHGRSAELLGLTGELSRDHLSNLFDGFSPSRDEAYVKNAGSDSRSVGVEICFSPPKSLSLWWALSGTETRREIEKISLDAVKEALEFGSRHLFRVRRGTNGVISEPTEPVSAIFEHGSSRPETKTATPDPQLHHHVLVPNVGFREDGTTGALDLRSLFRHKLTLGALYDLACSNAVEKSLNLKVERTEKGFWEIAGIPEKILREFSSRREAIEKRLGAELMSSSKARERANLHTREHKRPIERQKLFEQWSAKARRLGFSLDRLQNQRARSSRRESLEKAFGDSLKEALTRLTDEQSHFSFPELVRHVAQASHGRGLSVKDVLNGSEAILSREEEIVRLGEHQGELRFTTREMFETERSLLSLAEGTRAKSSQHVLRRKTAEASLREAFSTFEPSEEQLAALFHLTTEKGGLQILTGGAGTGKSALLKALRLAYEREGFQVLGAAIAARTARGLERDTGIQSTTVAKLLFAIERNRPWASFKENLSLKPLIWDLFNGRGVRNRPLFPKPVIPKRSVLVLDEAGMVGTRDLERILRETERLGTKLILVGDPAQLQPIAAGLPLATLSEKLGDAKLTQIVRQREEWAREAARDLRDGNAPKVLKDFKARGLLFVGKGMDEAARRITSDWLKSKAPIHERLLLAGERREVSSLNRRIQLERSLTGELGPEFLELGPTRFYVGDRVLFERNQKTIGVDNGDLGTVVAVSSKRGMISVKLDRGQQVLVKLSQYTDLSLGYAVTTHKAQGMTVEEAFVLVGGGMQTRELSYVQGTRARKETRLYTSELVAGESCRDLAASMSLSRRKEMACDLIEGR